MSTLATGLKSRRGLILKDNTLNEFDVLIIGGGAAGYFAAITCGEAKPELKIALLEGTNRTLTKVKISGGGRCNVTHNCLDPVELCGNYPRGHKELRQVFYQFHVKDTINWFKKRGVELHAEADGRMFATSNKSQTIIDCLSSALEDANVTLLKGHLVKTAAHKDGKFQVLCAKKPTITCKQLLLATGGAPIGHKIAKVLGHKVTSIVPSLFTFTINDAKIADLAGLSFEHVNAKLGFDGSKKKFSQQGPLLVTHWGLSGPSILKLSAWAARELAESNYKANLEIDLLPKYTNSQINASISQLRRSNSKKSVFNSVPAIPIPRRFWIKILQSLNIPADLACANLSNRQIENITTNFKKCMFKVSAKGEYKDEFVSCGGVDLKEVNTKTLESKHAKGLFFAGEVLNVDGVTGGFNFQNAWSTAWIAGKQMASWDGQTKNAGL